MSPQSIAVYYTILYQRVKKNRQLNPRPFKLPVGAGGEQGGGTYLRLKDSNAAVGVRDRATGKALEGANRQTERQTDFSCITVR